MSDCPPACMHKYIRNGFDKQRKDIQANKILKHGLNAVLKQSLSYSRCFVHFERNLHMYTDKLSELLDMID